MKNTIIKVLSVMMAMVMAFGACLVSVSAVNVGIINDGECDHANYKMYSTVEATCEGWGYTLYECQDCGDLFTKQNLSEFTKPHSLTPGFAWTYETEYPTCKDEGREYKICSVCEEETLIRTLDKTDNHVWGPEVETSKPTCTGDSVKVHTCTICGITESVNGDPATGHDWAADYTTLVTPTCQEEGKITFRCSVCEASRVIVIKPCACDYEELKQVDPTCTTPGHSAGNFCKWCGEGETSSDVVYEATGHAFDSTSANHKDEYSYIAPDRCVADGRETGYCTVCKKVVTRVVPKAECNIQEKVGEYVAPTCGKAGQRVYACLNCQAEEVVVLDALEHDYWYTGRVGATCTLPGGSLYTCRNCNKTAIDPDIYQPALEHDLEDVEALAPTCTLPGNTAGVQCKRCDYHTWEEIEATGHVYTLTKTCTDSGLQGRFCKCGDLDANSQTTYVQAESDKNIYHAWFEVSRTEASCNAEGSINSACAFCGETTTAVIAKTPHTIVVENFPATHAAFAYTHEYCTVCAYEKDTTTGNAFDPNGHLFVEETNKYEAPTCYATGTKYFKCVLGDCEVTKTETVAAKGHVFVVVPGTPATCTTPGLTDGKWCKNCSSDDGDNTNDLWVIRQRVIDAKDHNWQTIPAVDPTCHTVGYTSFDRCVDCKVLRNEQFKTEVPELNIASVIAYSQDATCEGEGAYGFDFYTCGECACEECSYIDNFQFIPEHVWSDVQTDKEEATCESDGYWYKECLACGEEEVTRVTEVTKGHHDIEGNLIPTSCTRGEIENIHCEHCDQDVAIKHDMEFIGTEDATCDVYAKNIYACKKCGHEEVEVISDALLGHTWIIERESPEAATYEKAVWVSKICDVCGKDESAYETANGVEFSVEVVNGAGKDLHFVNGSQKVQVKIYVRGDQVKFNNLFFSFTYNPSAFAYKGADFSGNFTEATDFDAFNDNGKINIVYFASKDKDGKVQDVTLTGEKKLLTVINFEVKKTYYSADNYAQSGVMNFVDTPEMDANGIYKTGFIVVNSNGAALTNNLVLGKAQDLDIYKLGNLNDDQYINNYDGLKMLELIAASEIWAEADIDFDGEVTAKDFGILRSWIVGSRTYPN